MQFIVKNLDVPNKNSGERLECFTQTQTRYAIKLKLLWQFIPGTQLVQGAVFLHVRFFFYLSFTAYEKTHFIFVDMWFIFWNLKVKPRLCTYNPIDRRNVTFLHTMEMLKLYIYLCCYFTFVWFHFSALCGDSAVWIVWLGLGTKKHLKRVMKIYFGGIENLVLSPPMCLQMILLKNIERCDTCWKCWNIVPAVTPPPSPPPPDKEVSIHTFGICRIVYCQQLILPTRLLSK